MKQVLLPGAGFAVSRLGYGTASLHHLWSSAERQRLLAGVADCGIRHLDTAPYYGYGLAEAALGKFLAGNKTGFTVATKIGLYPSLNTEDSAWQLWAAKFAGKTLAPKLSKPVVDFAVRTAATSLDRSLTRLGLDRLDFLMIHEPLATLLVTDEIFGWLEAQQQAGKIRAWGLAGDLHTCPKLVAGLFEHSPVLQTRDSLGNREANFLAELGVPLQFTFGYLSAQTNQPKAEVFRAALKRNQTGTIIISTRNVGHLRQLTQIADA